MKRLATAMLLCGAWVGTAAASDLQDGLEGRWRGAWVLTRVETYADCAGLHTNNRVNGNLVDGRGRFRFAAGELAKIVSVDLKRSRLDLDIKLTEPNLVSHTEGPFTLFSEANCQIELQVEVPRSAVSGKNLPAVESLLQPVLLRFASVDEARQSRAWNRRKRAAYPPDYDRTLARYAAWKAQRTNDAVQARLDQARDETARLTDRITSDPDYLRGFAAGVEAMKESDPGGCSQLVGLDLAAFEKPPAQQAASANDAQSRADRGRRDGRRLVLGLEMLRRLPACFVEVPRVDDGTASSGN